MKKFAFLAASVLSVLATTAPVSAQTVYSDRAAFLAAVTGATTTTFNNVTNDIAVGSGNTVQGFTFSGSTQSQSLIDAPAFDYNPVNGIDGTTYLNLAGLANGATFNIGLGSAVNAFGFDTHNYDIGDDRSEVFIGGQSLGLTPASRGGVGFLGFVATAGSTFSTVSIVGRGFDVYNGFDNFTTAAGLAGGVPEPATWAMMIVGFGLVGGAVRRRNRVATRVSLA